MKNKPERDAALVMYLFRKKLKKGILKFFTIVLIMGLCFTICYPLLSLVPVGFSSIEELGNPNVIWIPLEKSVISFQAAARFILPDGFLTMVRSILYAVGIMLIQIFFFRRGRLCAGEGEFLGAQAWRLEWLRWAFLCLPRQLPFGLRRHIYFNHFDILGITEFVSAKQVSSI